MSGKIWLILLIGSLGHLPKIQCNFELEISLHSFDIPMGNRICDQSQLSRYQACDSFFMFCLRPVNFPVSFEGLNRNETRNRFLRVCQGASTVTTEPLDDTNSANFSDPSVFSIEGGTEMLWPSEGMQLFLAMLDEDDEGEEDLIDIFTINISVPINSIQERRVYTGLLARAELGLEFRVTDSCYEIECGPNERCVDGECVCEPGYTGPECLTDVCDGIDCSGNGNCIAAGDSYQCSCEPLYTGELCDTRIHGYELFITVNSYSNPDHRCAGCRPDACCDFNCDTGFCDTIFYLCLRPYESEVTTSNRTRQGDCPPGEIISTRPDINSDGRIFNNFLLNIPNPIRFSHIPNPSEGTQLYLELIDDNSNVSNNADKLIDRYILDVRVPVGTRLVMTNLMGQFNITTINVQFEAQCMPGFTGAFCTEVESEPDSNSRTTVIVIAVEVAFSAVALIAIMLVMCVVYLRYRRRKKERMRRSSEISSSNPQNRSLIVDADQDTGYSVLGSQYHILTHNNMEAQTHGQSRPKIVVHRPRAKSDANYYDRLENISTAAVATSRQTSSQDLKEEEEDVARSNSYSYARVDQPLAERAEQFRRNHSNLQKQESHFWQPSAEEEDLLKELKLLKLKIFNDSELEFQQILGYGAFAEVSKGVWHSSGGESAEKKVEVAIKSMKKDASEENRIKFLQEAAIMGQFDHPSIVHVYGILATAKKYCIIVELMTNGSLSEYLRSIQPQSFDEMELRSHLLSYSRQVANGMEYLRVRGFIHRDLAARNILLSKNNICKIADFGLSRGLKDEDFYLSRGGKIPVKWTAPEAMQYNLYSSASDIWSYGIVLYEIWSLGKRPYHGLSGKQVPEQLSTGYRLAPPPGCPRDIYKIMIQCWHDDANRRPNFAEVIELLNQPEFKILKWAERDTEAYEKDCRTVGAPLECGEYLYSDLQRTYKDEDLRLVPFL